MPSAPLPHNVRDLLIKANPAVIAANRPDGQPVSVATWYLLEDDDRILINMDAGRRRLSYLRNDPRVSLTVLSEANWGTHVSVQGRIVDLSPDHELAGIDRLALRYFGGPYPVRDRDRVNAWIKIEFWHAWQLKD